MTISLSGLYVWRRIVALGYFGLESALSTLPLIDEGILCVDPDSGDETLELANRISQKYSKFRVVEFRWPRESLNGSVIGMATNYALGLAHGDWCVNIQADEVWPPQLMEYVKENWRKWPQAGADGINIKVLHTEWNASGLQGGGDWNRQLGSAYTHSIKLFKHCPAIRFAPDAWSVDGCAVVLKLPQSEKWPILHLHDFHRDTVMERRRVQAEELWPTTPHYGDTYHKMLDGYGQWKGLLDDPKWLQTTSPFEHLMPEYVKACLGKVKYEINWNLLQ